MDTHKGDEMKILVVDDDPVVRTLIGRQLEQFLGAHATIAYATNGKDGFEYLIKFNPTILITDRQMPKWDGMELARKARKFNSSLAIIMISSDPPTTLDGSGIDLALNKPVYPENLRDALRQTGFANHFIQ